MSKKPVVTDSAGHPTQAVVGAHLDLSDRSVREWEDKLQLAADYTLADFRIAYIRRLREEAAGRAADGGLDLAGERARLAAAQADRVEMQNAVSRGELAPVADMEHVLASVGVRVGRILDTVVPQIRRRVPGTSAEVLQAIEGDISKCRNMVAAMSLADILNDDEEAEEGGDTFDDLAGADDTPATA